MKIRVSVYNDLWATYGDVGYFVGFEDDSAGQTIMKVGKFDDGKSFKQLSGARRAVNRLKATFLNQGYRFQIVEE